MQCICHHRLNGRLSSPVLTATNGAYWGLAGLSDFIRSRLYIGVRLPTDLHAKWLKRGYSRKDVPFAVKIATIHIHVGPFL